jgi:hypothetical protein
MGWKNGKGAWSVAIFIVGAEKVRCTLFFTEREFTRVHPLLFRELEFDFISVVEEWGQMKNLLIIFKFN